MCFRTAQAACRSAEPGSCRRSTARSRSTAGSIGPSGSTSVGRVHAPPRVRGGLGARLVILVAGLFVFAVAIVAQLESRLGLSPWDTLHQGIAKHTPLSFGVANICVSAVVVTVAWLLGARIGIGTLANAVLVGGFIQALTAIGPVDRVSDS